MINYYKKYQVLRLVVPATGILDPTFTVSDLAVRCNTSWATALQVLLTAFPKDFSGLALRWFGNDYWNDRLSEEEMEEILH